MLRKICGREYERIINTPFYEFITHLMRKYYRCEKIVRILPRCDKYVRICHTCDRFVLLSHSNEYVTCVKNSHVFVKSVKNSNEFFTGVTNTCEFFTRLKLDICEKLVPIKISKLVVRKFHTYQNVIYSCE